MNRDFRLCLRLCRDESPWQENPKIFWRVTEFLGRFFGVPTAFGERQDGFGVWKTPRGVQNALFSRDYGPDLARKWAITARVLPRKTLVLATMLWSGVDGIGVFLRSLARELRAGLHRRGAEHAEDGGGLGNPASSR